MTRLFFAFTLCLSFLLASPSVFANEAAMPELTYEEDPAMTDEPSAFFAEIKDGDTVASPVHIVFGVTGLEIAPAGTETPGTGHFHLLIDTDLTPGEMALPIPADERHVHYGKGQSEADLDLTPGPHTLQIVMGDGNHMLHTPPVMSEKITVTVSAVPAEPSGAAAP